MSERVSDERLAELADGAHRCYDNTMTCAVPNQALLAWDLVEARAEIARLRRASAQKGAD